jgi:aspartyl protease family protein
MRTVASAVCAALVLAALALKAGGQENSLEVQAVLGNTAVLLINGQRKTLKVGEASDGITVLATQPTAVTLEINGREETVGLSRRVSTTYEKPEEHIVTIARNAQLQYHTTATINGRNVLAMVDTGANLVAMNSVQAKSMNIDYGAGIPAQVETASGVSEAYLVTLQSVSVGEIQVNNVPAMVVRGGYPATVLLGMSYLRHVKMEEQNGILSLTRRN